MSHVVVELGSAMYNLDFVTILSSGFFLDNLFEPKQVVAGRGRVD